MLHFVPMTTRPLADYGSWSKIGGTFQDGNRPEFAAKLSMMPREGETIHIDDVEFKVVNITYTAFGDVFKDRGRFWRDIVISISAV